MAREIDPELGGSGGSGGSGSGGSGSLTCSSSGSLFPAGRAAEIFFHSTFFLFILAFFIDVLTKSFFRNGSGRKYDFIPDEWVVSLASRPGNAEKKSVKNRYPIHGLSQTRRVQENS